jgi:hypothetical protein
MKAQGVKEWSQTVAINIMKRGAPRRFSLEAAQRSPVACRAALRLARAARSRGLRAMNVPHRGAQRGLSLEAAQRSPVAYRAALRLARRRRRRLEELEEAAVRQG